MDGAEKTDSGRRWRRRLLVIPPLAVGAALLALAVTSRDPPAPAEGGETPRAVRVITAAAIDVVPRAVAYGTVEPAETWTAVAEVSGRIAERHPDLEQGQLLLAETIILRIDETDYRLTESRLAAAVAQREAELQEMAIRESNAEQSLAIEQRALALAEDELARQERLRSQGTASQAAVDAAEQVALSSRQRVQDLQNQIALIPAERAVIEAALAVDRTQLRQAEIDLTRTVIRLPFDARVAEVDVEAGEFVQIGQALAVLDGIARAEITGRLPPERLAPVFGGIDIALGELSAAEFADLPGQIDLSAQVRLSLGGQLITWPARLDRIRESVDPTTRTVGVVLTVDDPLRQAEIGVRPPLTKNMFVEIALAGPALPGRIVVPRAALVDAMPADTPNGDGTAAGGQAVLLADPEDRLVIRPVTVAWEQDGLAVLAGGVADGERVVITDLSPAIAGMALATSLDDAAQARLTAAATAGLDAQ